MCTSSKYVNIVNIIYYIIFVNRLDLLADMYRNPCQPSPCGPNSQCREVNSQAVCSCLPDYLGSPPSCRPECSSNSDCPPNRACQNQRCVDPCPGTCGLYAKCTVVNHNPFCSCNERYTGNPFAQCRPISEFHSRFKLSSVSEFLPLPKP